MHTRKLRNEAAVERKSVRDALATKVDMTDVEAQQVALSSTVAQIASLREQLILQGESAAAQAEEAARASSAISAQLGALSRDVDERVAQAQRAVEMRGSETATEINAVAEQLHHMQKVKANHEELLALVAKLQHRPKPGVPFGVTPLLTVPYPLPPGSAMVATASPRRRNDPLLLPPLSAFSGRACEQINRSLSVQLNARDAEARLAAVAPQRCEQLLACQLH